MYKLVLLRHGQSQWNLENRFTGWTDVDLTEQGKREAETAGKLFLEAERTPLWCSARIEQSRNGKEARGRAGENLAQKLCHSPSSSH